MAEFEKGGPITIDYAGASGSRSSVFASPGPAFRVAGASLLIALAALPFLILARDRLFMMAGAAGFLASLIAFLCAGAALLQNRGHSRQSPLRLSMARVSVLLAMAFALLQLNGWSCGRTGDRIADWEAAHITNLNLRGIAIAADQYRQNYSVPADGLDSLVRAGLVNQKSLALPRDPAGLLPGQPGFVPSIVFMPDAAKPGAPPTSILAYERGPWSTDAVRFISAKLHTVVYVNGATGHLASSELAAALARQQLPTAKAPMP